MARDQIRSNPAALRWLRSAAISLPLLLALRSMPFYPDWMSASASLVVFALAMWTPAVALLAAVAVMAVPVAAADFVAGALLCVAGFALTQALSSREAAGGMAAVIVLASLPLGAGFAGPVLAGYLFGLRDGAPGAGLGATAAIASGILLGAERVGILFSGGHAAARIVSLSGLPADPLAFGWIADSISKADPARVVQTLAAAHPTWILVAQPLLWVLASAAASWLRGADRGPSERARAVAGLALLVLIFAGIQAALLQAAGTGLTASDLGRAAGWSLVAVIIAGVSSEWVFPLASIARTAPRSTTSSLRAEEADVDELLRLIASAEEELASRHTRNAVVVLTDLKAFSQMTERLGSVECAKIVQRHRDALLPVIERHGGRGKPTGGDGLVAAFDDSAQAVAAAVEMQETLSRLGTDAALPEELAMRIGIASGEVVVDAGGRPFLGAALNLAARVMGLADGGRIFVTGDVARATQEPHPALHSHGEFELKNIARPVEVVEVLWRPDMQPQPIDTGGTESATSGPHAGPDA
ncbi:MAG: adenylate/guanylate cyclase domain-containing protein [Coriobacteriia bacterium]|nr:adenylate/guanylate cyclase domain-containing protein [Coriobacteriia bacterium]